MRNKWWIGDTVRNSSPEDGNTSGYQVLRRDSIDRGRRTWQDWPPQVQMTSFKEDLQHLGIPDELHYTQGSTGW